MSSWSELLDAAEPGGAYRPVVRRGRSAPHAERRSVSHRRGSARRWARGYRHGAACRSHRAATRGGRSRDRGGASGAVAGPARCTGRTEWFHGGARTRPGAVSGRGGRLLPADVEHARPRAADPAFGEMVGLLWIERQQAAAIRLEQYWNEVLTGSTASLFCAYPIDVFDAAADSGVSTPSCAPIRTCSPDRKRCLSSSRAAR